MGAPATDDLNQVPTNPEASTPGTTPAPGIINPQGPVSGNVLNEEK